MFNGLFSKWRTLDISNLTAGQADSLPVQRLLELAITDEKTQLPLEQKDKQLWLNHGTPDSFKVDMNRCPEQIIGDQAVPKADNKLHENYMKILTAYLDNDADLVASLVQAYSQGVVNSMQHLLNGAYKPGSPIPVIAVSPASAKLFKTAQGDIMWEFTGKVALRYDTENNPNKTVTIGSIALRFQYDANKGQLFLQNYSVTE